MTETIEPTVETLRATVEEQAELIRHLSLQLEMHTDYLEEHIGVRDERCHALEIKVLNQREQLRQLNEALWRRKHAIRKLRAELEELREDLSFQRDSEERAIA